MWDEEKDDDVADGDEGDKFEFCCCFTWETATLLLVFWIGLVILDILWVGLAIICLMKTLAPDLFPPPIRSDSMESQQLLVELMPESVLIMVDVLSPHMFAASLGCCSTLSWRCVFVDLSLSEFRLSIMTWRSSAGTAELAVWCCVGSVMLRRWRSIRRSRRRALYATFGCFWYLEVDDESRLATTLSCSSSLFRSDNVKEVCEDDGDSDGDDEFAVWCCGSAAIHAFIHA